MLTGRMRIRAPGILAPSDTDTPSSGWTVRMIWFACTPTDPELWNARCGTGFNVTAISVTFLESRLPVRRTNGTPAHRQFETCRRSAAYVSVLESAATP